MIASVSHFCFLLPVAPDVRSFKRPDPSPISNGQVPTVFIKQVPVSARRVTLRIRTIRLYFVAKG